MWPVEPPNLLPGVPRRRPNPDRCGRKRIACKHSSEVKMYVVETDIKKRLIVISAAGKVTAEQVKEAAGKVREVVKDAQPGFRVLTDFRWLNSMESSAAKYVAAMMDAFTEAKVASVVRVMPDPHKDIGFNILSQFHYGPETPVENYESLAEALQAVADALAEERASGESVSE